MKSEKKSLETDPSVLTPRELHTLIMLAQGFTCREIAADMNPGLSVKTVDSHRGKMLKKLGLRNLADITRYAIKHGIIDVEGNELDRPYPAEASGPPESAGPPEA